MFFIYAFVLCILYNAVFNRPTSHFNKKILLLKDILRYYVLYKKPSSNNDSINPKHIDNNYNENRNNNNNNNNRNIYDINNNMIMTI